ncbi:conserved hypothetical protein [Rhodobacteraceae bacterium HTCC2083]|nr:conserved hypothetical protein [Rhodobacteraceae bacterium HTCC2083]
MLKKVLNRSEAADYLTSHGYSIRKTTLQKLASVGGGPRYRIFGNRAVYTLPDLDTWLTSKLSPLKASTSVDVQDTTFSFPQIVEASAA